MEHGASLNRLVPDVMREKSPALRRSLTIRRRSTWPRSSRPFRPPARLLATGPEDVRTARRGPRAAGPPPAHWGRAQQREQRVVTTLVLLLLQHRAREPLAQAGAFAREVAAGVEPLRHRLGEEPLLGAEVADDQRS